MSKIIKIKLAGHLPAHVKRKLGENEKLCSKCGGIGMIAKPSKEKPEYIDICRSCDNGRVHVCPHCGKENPFTYCGCLASVKKTAAERTIELWAKAEKITPEEAAKRGIEVFADPYTEKYYFGWDDFDKTFDFESDPYSEKPPAFVWATTATNISMNAADIIEGACEDLHEDAIDNISDADEKELQDFLDSWCEKQNCVTYWANEKIAIIPDK